MEKPPEPLLGTPSRKLYWWVGGVALAIYLATLNRWVSPGSLFVLAEIHHWNWPPSLLPPVLYLFSLPFRCLPAGWLPIALNLASAALAPLTLMMLARAVALLPHDLTVDQERLLAQPNARFPRPIAWLPPVFAAVALGLELSFWEHATAGSGEMLDLFLLACAVWCMLEYRADSNQRWLDRAALTTGLGVANSWTFIGFVPIFVVALFRLRRLKLLDLRFFLKKDLLAALKRDFRFFARVLLWGTAGFSILLISPTVQRWLSGVPGGFWQTLLSIARSSKTDLFNLRGQFWFHAQGPSSLALLASVSLMPPLFLCIRWSDFMARKWPGVVSLETAVFCIGHAILLLTSLVVVFDPPFGPRQVVQRLGLPIPLLGLYYLAALSIGYYSCFFLFVFVSSIRHAGFAYTALRWTAPKAIYALLGLAFVGLLARNVPIVRILNGPHLTRFSRLVIESLPPEGGVVFSSDEVRLLLMSAALERNGESSRYLLVNSSGLGLAPYRAWLRQRYPASWLAANQEPAGPPASPGAQTGAETLALAEQLRLIAGMAASNRVFYLDWTLGPLFEHAHLEPCGLVFELKPNPADRFSAPPPSREKVDANLELWQRVADTAAAPVVKLVQRAADVKLTGGERMKEWAHLKMPLPATIAALAKGYSCDLNTWGAYLQKATRWKAATGFFSLAVELNRENVLARANLRCNQEFLAGHAPELPPGVPLADLPLAEGTGAYTSWDALLAANGPCDEPNYCSRLSISYAKAGQWVQAGEQLERVSELVPDNLEVRLALLGLYVRNRMPATALRLIEEIRSSPAMQPPNPKLEVELGFLTAAAQYSKPDRAAAESAIQALLAGRPADLELLDRARQVFLVEKSFAAAVRAADLRLQITPDHVPAFLDKGLAYLRSSEFSNAIPVFSHVLSLTNSYEGRNLRALAYQGAGNLDAAAADCEELLKEFPADYQPYFGLAEIALQKRDTNSAIRYYQTCLDQSVPGSETARLIAARLREIQPVAR